MQNGTILLPKTAMQNGSLIDEPNPGIVKFYYYYSYFTLSISWTLAPLLFYTILTQSKPLGKFKWLIFNYSFWSLCFTSLLSLVKALMFLPAAAGIQIGIFRDLLGYRSTIVFSVLCLALRGTCFPGLCSTLAYRYLFVFPTTLTEWLTLKKAFIFTLCFPVIGYVLLMAIFLPIIDVTVADIHEWAKSYDIFLEKYFHENTFFALSYQMVHIPAKIVLAFLITAFAIGICIIAFLYYQLKNYKTQKQSKILNGLILSSVIQVLVSLAFFVTPCILFFGCISFQIRYSSTLFVIAMSLMISHCFIDFLVTLYFIAPYRKFLLTLLRLNYAKVSAQNESGRIQVNNE